MRAYTIFVFALVVTAILSFSYDAFAGSKTNGGFETMAASKKCKKGFTYSESQKKCIRKGGSRY
ncbi:MAG: hypothetical protein AAGF48_04595 [Pseudomonadota bacterium]